MVKVCAVRAISSQLSGKRGLGFTIIELMVTVAVLAVVLMIAIPGFGEQLRAGRVQMAADGLKRSVAKARDVARDTGRRTILTINGTAAGVSGCDDAAWVVTQGSDVVSCLTKADFAKRYEGASINSSATTVVSFLPSGVGYGLANGSGDLLTSMSYELKAGSASKTVQIKAGGVADVL